MYYHFIKYGQQMFRVLCNKILERTSSTYNFSNLTSYHSIIYMECWFAKDMFCAKWYTHFKALPPRLEYLLKLFANTHCYRFLSELLVRCDLHKNKMCSQHDMKMIQTHLYARYSTRAQSYASWTWPYRAGPCTVTCLWSTL